MRTNEAYRPYQYLDPGTDFKPFKMAAQTSRVEPYDIGLSAAQQNRATQILESNMILSLHDHIRVLPEDPADFIDYFGQRRPHLAYEGIAESALDGVFENFSTLHVAKHGWSWEDTLHDIGIHYADIAHQSRLVRAESVDDILEAKQARKVALIASLECSTPIEADVDRIDVLYGFGVRCIGIAYGVANHLGSGSLEPHDAGLTPFGIAAVRRMNQLGMAIDVSHCGDQTSLDVIRTSSVPVLITHAGSRALRNTSRMKPDHVLRECAERGGVIGISASPHTTVTPTHPEHSIESVMEHLEYCINLVGIEHVGLGPDAQFGDHVAYHTSLLDPKALAVRSADSGFPQVPYVAGMENPAEAMSNAAKWLVVHGYSDDEVGLILGANAIRVLREIWAG